MLSFRTVHLGMWVGERDLPAKACRAGISTYQSGFYTGRFLVASLSSTGKIISLFCQALKFG